MQLKGQKSLVKFGKPTLRVWDPVVSKVPAACPDCGLPCHLAMDGRTLLDPRYMRERKPGSEVKYEAQRHLEHCPNRGLR